MPAIHKIAFLGFFGVAMRLIMAAANGRIPDQWKLPAGGGVFVVFTVAALIQMGGEKARIAMKKTDNRLIRRVLARHLLPLRERPDDEREILLKAYQRVEGPLVVRSIQVLNQAISLGAAILLIGVLLALITFLVPVLGGMMILGGGVLFLFFRYGIGHRNQVPGKVTDKA